MRRGNGEGFGGGRGEGTGLREILGRCEDGEQGRMVVGGASVRGTFSERS